MAGNAGTLMKPMLLCTSFACGKSISMHVPARSVPDVGGKLTCPECGDDMLLASYGVIDGIATVSSLDSLGLLRAQGTWWH